MADEHATVGPLISGRNNAVLGAVRQATGSFTPGFMSLALFAIIYFVVVFKSGSKPDIKTSLVSHGVAA
ncbi:MAG TPA: hypothetical protein VI479_00285 [Blastocatellia bacterium]